jgi:hypothetical protein
MRAFLWFSLLALALHSGGLALADEPKLSQAHAGFQLRLDYLQNHGETDNVPNDNAAMTIFTGRMSVAGDLTERVSYLIRMDVKTPFLYTQNFNGQDTGIGALERAFIDDRVTPWLKVRVGRQPFMAGAIDFDYSSMDLYMLSWIYQRINFQAAPAADGIDLSFKVGTGTLQVQAVNGVQEGTGATKGVQKAGDNSYAVGYRGTLLGGVLKPILSYDQFNRIRNGAGATVDDKVAYTAWAAGAQISYAHADLDLEYDTFDAPAFKAYVFDANGKGIEADRQAEKIRTPVAQLAYNATNLHLRPFVKGMHDVATIGGEASKDWTQCAGGVELRPEGNVYRYHAVIINQHLENSAAGVSGVTRVTTNNRQYIVGMAAKI